MNPFVSIIIPTFNRAHLIGETLDSVLAQTYQNWECIIVDDGSTDGTEKVIEGYLKKDARFHYFRRPSAKPKGANACRNIGLDNAQGDYTIFFDSDDLMTKDHLEVKTNALQGSGLDYVFTRTKYFNSTKSLDNYYKFDVHELTPFNYIAQHINWLTLDICLKSSLAKKIRFNERLQSGQEYNYYCQLVLLSTQGKFIDKTVSLRRHHDNSTQSKIRKDKLVRAQQILWRDWLTYIDIQKKAPINCRKILLIRCIRPMYLKRGFCDLNPWRFSLEVIKTYHWPSLHFFLMLLARNVSNRGIFFRTQLEAVSPKKETF